jgi:uncharacterized membrane protein YbaN (DUF454 family)
MLSAGPIAASQVHSPNCGTAVGDAQRTPGIPAAAQPVDGQYVRHAWRALYITLAGVSFVLGMIGIVLPGLPTTPFLLLTSYFLARSSPRMHRRLLANKLVGPILRHWQQHRAVEPRVKRQAVLLVGLAMVFLISFSNLPPVLLATVLALASIGLLVIYRLPTVKHKAD